MRISTKGEYGLRALLDLAQREGQGPIQSATIAARQQVPENYLSQLLLILRNAGFVRSVRGPQGGHLLARPPREINLGEVLTALEGPLVPQECVEPGYDQCCLQGHCTIRDFWLDLKAATDSVIYSTTLADLLGERRATPEPMYYI